MANLARQLRFDAEAYLEWEARQTDKHEYLAGEIFAMTGARRTHVLVAGNVFAAHLQLQLRWRPLWGN